MNDKRRTDLNDRKVVETKVVGPVHPGISWGAVFAGVAITFTVMVVLNLLAMGIGLGSIEVTGEDTTPVQTVATGFGVTMVMDTTQLHQDPTRWWFLPWMSDAMAPPTVTCRVPGVTGTNQPSGTSQRMRSSRLVPARAVTRPRRRSRSTSPDTPVVEAT